MKSGYGTILRERENGYQKYSDVLVNLFPCVRTKKKSKEERRRCTIRVSKDNCYFYLS